ncbi:hypothetical protein [Methylotenera sp.]|uniref:hypothetical protein n=1 Tax=Methylotenera sp. TaxID=2051956 RepID=UPI002731068F|nr:hypothetical protein [Methylotenera sp.]MDP2071430.1 hypothetical protein [Methylotenera sp.]MDP3005391.1 hypothetical protein [Methylotenera sp.]
MNLSREKEAVSAYLKLLQSKGATSNVLYKRSLFLDQLSIILADKALDTHEYSRAVDAIMESIPADDWHVNLNTAREFYPFWMKDIKAIAAFSLNYGFDVEAIQWKPLATSLKSLTDSLEHEKFDTSENWPLKAYSQVMRFEGADQSYVDTRIKLAKIILLRLRDAPIKNHKSYRTAADLTLPLFKIHEAKKLFLSVVREFYNFWTGNPNAASMLLKE